MARAVGNVHVAQVQGNQDLTFDAPTGTGSGNGIAIPFSASAPVAVIVKATGDPANLTIKANGTRVNGVLVPDLTMLVAEGADALVWVPPAYYANDNDGTKELWIDTDLATTGFAAVRFPAKYTTDAS